MVGGGDGGGVKKSTGGSHSLFVGMKKRFKARWVQKNGI
jgi:hypothetical protein